MKLVCSWKTRSMKIPKIRTHTSKQVTPNENSTKCGTKWKLLYQGFFLNFGILVFCFWEKIRIIRIYSRKKKFKIFPLSWIKEKNLWPQKNLFKKKLFCSQGPLEKKDEHLGCTLSLAAENFIVLNHVGHPFLHTQIRHPLSECGYV